MWKTRELAKVNWHGRLWHISTHADPTSTRHAITRTAHLLAWRLHRRISTVMFTCGWAWPARLSIRPFWASGEQSSQKWVIFFFFGRRWTAEKNLTPLALSSAGKSVNVQTHKQTVTDIPPPCLSACVDNEHCDGLERLHCVTELCTVCASRSSSCAVCVCVRAFVYECLHSVHNTHVALKQSRLFSYFFIFSAVHV